MAKYYNVHIHVAGLKTSMTHSRTIHNGPVQDLDLIMQTWYTVNNGWSIADSRNWLPDRAMLGSYNL